LVILVLGDLNSDCNGFVWQLRRIGKVRDRERERERPVSKTCGDYASTIREQRYVSEPIKTKFLNFDC